MTQSKGLANFVRREIIDDWRCAAAQGGVEPATVAGVYTRQSDRSE